MSFRERIQKNKNGNDDLRNIVCHYLLSRIFRLSIYNVGFSPLRVIVHELRPHVEECADKMSLPSTRHF